MGKGADQRVKADRRYRTKPPFIRAEAYPEASAV